MYVAIPAIGATVLIVVILMVLIRLWMVGAPKYTRKHVRFPNRFKYPNPDDKVQTKPRYEHIILVEETTELFVVLFQTATDFTGPLS